jgi:hypothetical protein
MRITGKFYIGINEGGSKIWVKLSKKADADLSYRSIPQFIEPDLLA